jgi:hypothetical protein
VCVFCESLCCGLGMLCTVLVCMLRQTCGQLLRSEPRNNVSKPVWVIVMSEIKSFRVWSVLYFRSGVTRVKSRLCNIYWCAMLTGLVIKFILQSRRRLVSAEILLLVEGASEASQTMQCR